MHPEIEPARIDGVADLRDQRGHRWITLERAGFLVRERARRGTVEEEGPASRVP